MPTRTWPFNSVLSLVYLLDAAVRVSSGSNSKQLQYWINLGISLLFKRSTTFFLSLKESIVAFMCLIRKPRTLFTSVLAENLIKENYMAFLCVILIPYQKAIIFCYKPLLGSPVVWTSELSLLFFVGDWSSESERERFLSIIAQVRAKNLGKSKEILQNTKQDSKDAVQLRMDGWASFEYCWF